MTEKNPFHLVPLPQVPSGRIKFARIKDVQENREPIVSEKAVEDFTRVCDETGILDQMLRVADALQSDSDDDLEKILREAKEI